jgi:hypothetical protein
MSNNHVGTASLRGWPACVITQMKAKKDLQVCANITIAFLITNTRLQNLQETHCVLKMYVTYSPSLFLF